MVSSLKNTAAIIGIANLKSTRSSEETAVEATTRVATMAIQDAGIDKDEIDGVLGSAGEGHGPSVLCEYIGLRPKYANSVSIGGASNAAMVWHAAAAINAGLCNTVLCVSANGRRPTNPMLYGKPVAPGTHGRGGGWGDARAEFETPYGPQTVTNSGYALIAQRHMYEYGTTSRQLAKIAVDQRTNACLNPDAMFYGKPITIEDVLNSPMVSSPLHLLEIVMPCSGGQAIIVTSAERAKRAVQPPVWLLGAGEYRTQDSVAYAPSMTTSPVKVAAEMAFKMAEVTPKQISLVEPYDCYTITVLVTLEDAGFCKKGQGGKFVENTDLTYRGELPCNTHGGQLSFGQAGGGGMSHVTEAVRQLMGRAGARQVKNPKLAYVNGNGGVMSEECSLILGV